MNPEKLEGVKITIIYVELALFLLIIFFGFVGKTEFVRRMSIGGMLITAVFMNVCLWQSELGPVWVLLTSGATLLCVIAWAITSLYTE